MITTPALNAVLSVVASTFSADHQHCTRLRIAARVRAVYAAQEPAALRVNVCPSIVQAFDVAARSARVLDREEARPVVRRPVPARFTAHSLVAA